MQKYLQLSCEWHTLSMLPQLSSHWLVRATSSAQLRVGRLPIFNLLFRPILFTTAELLRANEWSGCD